MSTQDAKPMPIQPGDPDILEVTVTSGSWISDNIIRGRRIKLSGIQIHVLQEGDTISLSPVIPSMSMALRILKANPQAIGLNWNGKEWK